MQQQLQLQQLQPLLPVQQAQAQPAQQHHNGVNTQLRQRNHRSFHSHIHVHTIHHMCHNF